MIISYQLLFVAGRDEVGGKVLIEACGYIVSLHILLVPHMLHSVANLIGGPHVIGCQWYHPESGMLAFVPGEYHFVVIFNAALDFGECHFAPSIV